MAQAACAASRRAAAMVASLSCGPLLGPHLVQAECAANRLRDVRRSPVSMTMRVIPAWRSMRSARGESRRSSSASRMRAEHRAVRGDEGACCAFVTHAAQKALAPLCLDGAGSDVGVAANRDAASVDRAGDPGAGFFLDSLSAGRGTGRAPGRRRRRLGDGVLRGLVEAGRQPEHLVIRYAGGSLDGRQRRRARR